ncbi:hypothetical protein LEP1GSC127_3175 [Leptospira kirschneri str. 200801925]|nr:hypothetical protein LEP1GSC127_3175 [Leptospira kirschneri str. 200801925]
MKNKEESTKKTILKNVFFSKTKRIFQRKNQRVARVLNGEQNLYL